MAALAPVKTRAELEERLQMLPPFSRKVYEAVKARLYAEPGFSDVEPRDIALALSSVPQAVGGALTRLQEAGLVWLDTDGVNGEPATFIHTYEHDKEL